MSRLLLSFYGDDFTGSTDALEQLTLTGIRTALFIEPPTPAQLARHPGLRAIGVAGLTRSLPPDEIERELRPALTKLKALGARHVHYKVCSTFDSSPDIGSIGRVIDVAATIFCAPFVPVLAAAPALGRHSVFGNLFARAGIGGGSAIHRLDRHPSASRHPVTPMREADLQLHLARQTMKRIGLFDILKVALSPKEAQATLRRILDEGAEVVLFDALYQEQLPCIAALFDAYASPRRPLFSVGSSGVEMALGGHWAARRSAQFRLARNTREPRSASSTPLLVGSGSCSPVTAEQIAWALKHGFAAVALKPSALASESASGHEIQRATAAVTERLAAGQSVVVHTTRGGADKGLAARLKGQTAIRLGTALGVVLRGALERVQIRRLCVAGGDTASHVARTLGIEALEMIAPLTPGAPLCRVHAPGSPVDGSEAVFKGGQVGAEDYFGIVKRGGP